jgi:histidine triad (HIT) family protein
MTDCIFCKIIEGSLPARKVYEDDLVLAFWDARPVFPIHILIVPRKHVATLNDLAEGDGILSHMADVARKIAKEMGVADTGYRFYVNVNRDGGQMVFHLHAHLMAGKGMGSLIFKVALGLTVVWRRLVDLVRGTGPA